MALMKNSHVLAALVLLVVATAAGIGRGAEGANTPPANVGAANALVIGTVPCSTGSSINVATAPPFRNASLQLLCGTPALSSSRSKPANIAEREERRRESRRTGPAAVSAAGVTVWANARAGVNGDFAISLGVIRNSTSGGGGLLPSMLLAKQCSVVVTTPLAACDVSLAGVTGTLSAPVQVLGGGPIISGLVGLVAGPFSFSVV